MNDAPVILMVTDRKSVTSGAWKDIPNDALPHSYIDAVEQAGGVPLLLPPTETLLANADRLLQMADGIFLAGGRDLDAQLYGRENHPLNDVPLRVRDELEIALAVKGRALGMPILGACRGMQVLNVAFGGTLEQHLGDRLDMTPHRDVVGNFTAHSVAINPRSRLAENLGTDPSEMFSIASHHHQAVDVLGEGLVEAARAEDGVIEALESQDGDSRFCVGVQWHPEERLAAGGLRLLEIFTEAAREFRASSAVRETALRS